MWSKYLLITEDGQIFQVDEITDGDKSHCDDGILDIVAVPSMTQYHDGGWRPIMKLEQ